MEARIRAEICKARIDICKDRIDICICENRCLRSGDYDEVLMKNSFSRNKEMENGKIRLSKKKFRVQR